MDNEKNSGRCLGCGEDLTYHSILICAECLDDECGNFLKFASEIDESLQENNEAEVKAVETKVETI